ncbi:hypothetical protein VYU27_008174 [Nannochloropsis oceanica]
MRCAVSLLALGITLAVTVAEPDDPTLILTSIKAVDNARPYKDKWSMKGYLNDPEAVAIQAIDVLGMSAGIGNEITSTTLSLIEFDAGDCKLLKNDNGIICKTTGARVSFKRSKRVPKDAMIQAQRNRNTTTASSYYRVSGAFSRQEFNATVSPPLSAGVLVMSTGITDVNSKCTEKGGARVTKVFCTPGPLSPTRK